MTEAQIAKLIAERVSAERAACMAIANGIGTELRAYGIEAGARIAFSIAAKIAARGNPSPDVALLRRRK